MVTTAMILSNHGKMSHTVSMPVTTLCHFIENMSEIKLQTIFNPITIRIAIWRFSGITSRGMDQTIIANYPYWFYSPMHLS